MRSPDLPKKIDSAVDNRMSPTREVKAKNACPIFSLTKLNSLLALALMDVRAVS